jgi:hypothetical protein
MTRASVAAAKEQAISAASPRIFRIEGHDGGLPAWRGPAVAGRVLIRVDARDDKVSAGPQQTISTADFNEIRQAR